MNFFNLKGCVFNLEIIRQTIQELRSFTPIAHYKKDNCTMQ